MVSMPTNIHQPTSARKLYRAPVSNWAEGIDLKESIEYLIRYLKTSGITGEKRCRIEHDSGVIGIGIKCPF